MQLAHPKKGQLLIAKPSIIGDSSFNRSIILLVEHTTEGSIGFILNKPLNHSVSDLAPNINSDFKVYNGGPVEQSNLYFIHTVPNKIPESIEISMGVYWSGNFETVVNLINSNKIKEWEIRFFLGYSGWYSNQLDDELRLNSWVINNNSYKTDIIKKDYKSFWKEKMIEFGGEYSIWSNAPENPNLN